MQQNMPKRRKCGKTLENYTLHFTPFKLKFGFAHQYFIVCAQKSSGFNFMGVFIGMPLYEPYCFSTILICNFPCT